MSTKKKENNKRILIILGVIFVLLLGRNMYLKVKEPKKVEKKEKIVLENQKGNHTLMQDGKYQAQGEGYGGPITVELVVEDGYMKKIKIKDHNEDPGFAGLALEKIPKEITQSQNTNVDVIAGATQTINGIQEAVRTCIRQAGGE
ncbi:MAG: FMN-binding protein [Tissierellia bacterium]|nr:FMN-binding protein [Tissierellia bacterium]